jgi:hypothetical protein
MSIFRSGNKQQAITPDYTGLQIQTAVSALPIPIVWGMSKVAPNVIWYNNFRTLPQGSSGGGKGLFNSNGNAGQYDYTADVIMALCEGPIVGINQIWRGQSAYTLSGLGLALFTGTTPQEVWPYLASEFALGGVYDRVSILLGSGFTPTDVTGQIALAYQGTAYVAAANYDLTTSATLDNHNFEVEGFDFNTGYGPGYRSNDADPALVVNDFLTNAQFGVGFPSTSIDTTSLFGTGGDASYQTYCRAVGLALSPALTDAETASSVLSRWLQLTNTAAVWSGGLLRFVPYGDVSATNLSFTFNPNVTPIYDLDDDDYIVENNADPLQVSRSDLFDAYNIWRLECADRSNAYNLTTVEARDQNAIELLSQSLGGLATGARGERIAPTVTAHEICDTNVALISAQLMLQRAVYVRNTYKFRLSWEYCLLDPMDLVTITDPILGLTQAPVRITTIEEDEKGYLEITAEEFPLGYATATLYATRPVINNPIDRNIDPGAIATALIFEPTDQLGGGLTIMAGACSSYRLWGGCNIWLSYQEGGNYTQIGTINSSARIGVTTADLPPVGVSPIGETIDQINTLAVDLTVSAGVLASVTQADANALNSRCYVGGEIVAYETATLTAPNVYNLDYLVRGAYGTEDDIVDHPAGTVFARIDNAFFTYAYDQSRIGDTVYLKFQSFNIFGGGVQSLADCTAYAYQITGAALASPLPTVADLYSNFEGGFQKIYWDQIDDFRNGIVYEWRQGSNWDSAQFIRDYAHPPFIAQGNGTFLVKARCQPVAGLTVYSETAAEIVIAGNQLSLNLLASFDEKATGWTGTFQNGIGVDAGNLRLSGAGNILADNPLLESMPAAAAAAAGTATLGFAYLQPTITVGMAVADTTRSGVIPPLATVQAIDYGAGNLDYGAVTAVATTNVLADANVLTDRNVLGAFDYGAVTTAATADVDYGALTGITATVVITAPVTGAGVAANHVIVFSTPDVLDLGGIITGTPVYYTIPASHIINAGSVVQASVNASTQINGVPVGQNILADANVLQDGDILGSASTQFVDGWIEINVSQDGATWAGFQKFVPGVFAGMAWNFRLALQSNDPNTIAYALAFNFQVQLPARIDHYQSLTVPSSGLTIVFRRDGTTTPAPFNGGPGLNDVPYYSVSWQATAGDTYQIAGLSLSQLAITFFNGGVAQMRTGVNVTVEGF